MHRSFLTSLMIRRENVKRAKDIYYIIVQRARRRVGLILGMILLVGGV